MALSNERHYHFPLLSDFEPKGAIAKAYRVYDAKEGVAERACSSSTARRDPLELFVTDGR